MICYRKFRKEIHAIQDLEHLRTNQAHDNAQNKNHTAAHQPDHIVFSLFGHMGQNSP